MRYLIDVRYWHLADIGMCVAQSAFDPKRTGLFTSHRNDSARPDLQGTLGA
jgi:hypothetical protein